MEKENKIILENGLEIAGATLLTVEEAEKLPEETRAIGCWWWLRSPGDYGSYAAFVHSGGSVFCNGTHVYYNGAVRPALILNLKSSNLRIGDTFRFGEKDFEIISDTHALCTESIGKCAFREDWKADDANDYEVSDIRKFVEDWYQKSAPKNRINFCNWKLFDNAVVKGPLWTYSTNCGKYVSEDKTDENFKYCPYCSRKIKLTKK